MNPNTGDVFLLREELLGPDVGDVVEHEEYATRLDRLAGEISDDELRALEADRLVRVGEKAAQRLLVGQRELERRLARRRRRQ